MTFGQRARARRLEMGMSLADMSLEVSRDREQTSSICSYEIGRATPTVRRLLQISSVLSRESPGGSPAVEIERQKWKQLHDTLAEFFGGAKS